MPPVDRPRPWALPEQAAPPTAITIPAIAVQAPVLDLGLGTDGALEVPSDFSTTGWWRRGASPGERGPAVIVGHVDSQSGPAVFYRLSELREGDEILVARSDRSVVRFRVTRTRRFPKDGFPTLAVYGKTPQASLRLITCDGDFDRSTGHYEDNLVVFADRQPGQPDR